MSPCLVLVERFQNPSLSSTSTWPTLKCWRPKCRTWPVSMWQAVCLPLLALRPWGFCTFVGASRTAILAVSSLADSILLKNRGLMYTFCRSKQQSFSWTVPLQGGSSALCLNDPLPQRKRKLCVQKNLSGARLSWTLLHGMLALYMLGAFRCASPSSFSAL